MTFIPAARALMLTGFLLLALVTESTSSTAATPRPWMWPIDSPHPILAPFVAPATPYAPGHRGIDISTTPGASVSAAAPGVVTFSGTVVDRPLVVVRHEGGFVSSTEPVIGDVVVGETVTAGARLGVVGVGGHCGDRCVHFGVRLDGVYVNPMSLLGEVPPAVLLPLD